MATAFRSVNATALSVDPSTDDKMATSPTTPRPSTAPQSQPPPKTPDDATTPTRATFGAGAMSQQKPLPTSPFPQAVQVPDSAEKKVPSRENSQQSRKSRDSDDMDMDDSDGENGGGDDGASDGEESVNADGTRSNKKKKSQRFYCTDYPPCNLSFTRSEHLARHIRKHTGERPFQCHCSRRFSRLDNLRQHAQTVHVNEDIPMDSLAATGTRFQRQIRTDRVRQPGRARASTAGSTGTTGRGHSKSLSTSSIASIGSIGSNMGPNFSPREDVRRRPPPLVMADPRSRLSLESYRSGGEGQYYRPASPSDFSTPTSATFSTGQNSPHWGSGVASPTSSHSRAHSMYATGSRTPGRRLSVPSGGNPFQSPHGANVGRTLFGPGSVNSSNTAVFSSPNGSVLASPTTSTAGWSRRESMSSAADEAWRRRTWHPDTRDFSAGGSRLSNVITPSQFTPSPAPLPVTNNGGPQQTLRLPGIESFDPVPHRPVTPPRRNPSPMMIDSETVNPPTLLPAASVSEDRRNVAQWDMGLHRGLTRLDINNSGSTPPRDSAGAWANEVNQAVQAQAEQVRMTQPTVRFTEPQPQMVPMPQVTVSAAPPRGHQHTVSAPSISTPRDTRRHGWYHGPVTVHEDRVMESRPHVDRMVHPNISGWSALPARDAQAPLQQQPPPPTNGDSLRRLEALVAVATSEGSTATAY